MLLRPEVMVHRQQSAYDGVDLTGVRLGWPLLALAIAGALVLALFLAFGTHTRRLPASGQLVPAEGLISVVAPLSGTLVAVLVREGEVVRAGQPLLAVSREREAAAAGGRVLGESIAASLVEQRAQLQAELAALDEEGAAARRDAAAQRALLSHRRALSEEQATLARTQLESAERLHRSIRTLPSGTLTALQSQQYEADALRARAGVNQARLQALEIEREEATLRSSERSAQRDRDQRRRGILRQLAELEVAGTRNEVDRGELIVAPRAGVVSAVYVAAGQALQAGHRLLTLTPPDAALVAELWLPSEGLAAVTPGQRVALRYRAFPHRQYGLQWGHVRSVSGSPHSADEVYASSGMRVAESMFRVLVEPARDFVSSEGRRQPLRSGMYVDADLLLERRPLYRMVFAAGEPANAREGS